MKDLLLEKLNKEQNHLAEQLHYYIGKLAGAEDEEEKEWWAKKLSLFLKENNMVQVKGNLLQSQVDPSQN